jgi:hypothetical protein
VVARDTAVLAEYSAAGGNANSVARRILENLDVNGDTRVSFSQAREQSRHHHRNIQFDIFRAPSAVRRPEARARQGARDLRGYECVRVWRMTQARCLFTRRLPDCLLIVYRCACTHSPHSPP